MDKLWPEKSGNGNSYWKGKPIIPIEEWEEISGLAEINARFDELMSSPEIQERENMFASDGGYPSWFWDDLHNIRREIKHEAISYFPDGLIPVAANAPIVYKPSYDDESDIVTYWTCPGHQEEYNAWAADYREMLLKLKNLYEYEYMPDPENAKF